MITMSIFERKHKRWYMAGRGNIKCSEFGVLGGTSIDFALCFCYYSCAFAVWETGQAMYSLSDKTPAGIFCW
jgi:hypothetical protein